MTNVVMLHEYTQSTVEQFGWSKTVGKYRVLAITALGKLYFLLKENDDATPPIRESPGLCIQGK
jgi:hypothetical protein